MKNISTLIFLLLATFGIASAQTTPTLATSYFFKHYANIQLEDMSGATTLIGPTRIDDQVSASTTIPFSFEFVGQPFTAFQALSSGVMTLTNPGASPTGPYQILSPWGDGIGTGDNGHISYKIIGATNRKLVVEYYMGDYDGNTQFSMMADKKFQVWLFEHSNRIQFVYGNGSVNAAQATVGIAGNEQTGDLLQINTSTHTPLSSPDANYASTQWPGNGHSYLFSPTDFVVVTPTALISTTDAANVCEGGTVHFTASMQDASATGYQWLKNGLHIPGANSSTYDAFETGEYAVEISYATGTAVSASVNVFVTVLTASVTFTNPSCTVSNNGTITVNSAAGSNNVFEYSLGNSVWQESNVFTGLSAGTYYVALRSGSCVKALGATVINAGASAPVTTISVANNGACGSLVLTANPADATSYQWSNGETTRSINLDNNNADGNYSVSVSNGFGCTSSAAYNYNKQDQLSSYVVYVLKSAAFGEGTTVNGAIGNLGTTLPVYISKNSVVNGFVKSAQINVGQPTTVSGGLIYSPATVTIPTVYANTSVVSGLPSFTTADNFSGTNCNNYRNLAVGKKSIVTLSGNTYGKIVVKEGAVVNFTSKDISIDDLVTEDAKSEFTSVSFAAGTIIRIKNKVQFGKRSVINAPGSTFYLSDVNSDDEKFIINGNNTSFAGNVILLKGTLSIKGSDANNPCTMTGAFISEYINADKFVTWNRNTCNTFAPRKANPINVPLVNELKVNLYPNPTTGSFNLVVKTLKPTKATVIMLNENGVVVKHETFLNIQPGQSLPFNVKNQAAGVYVVKMITSEGTQTMKVVLSK